MTDGQIAEQLSRATQNALGRFKSDLAEARSEADAQRAIFAVYLSGANQCANFLVRMDGGCTPQQMERALLIVAGRVGLTLTRPDGTPADGDQPVSNAANAALRMAAHEKLLKAADLLMQIVEGCRNRRWNEAGHRLVDQPEWAAFYTAWSELHYPKPPPQDNPPKTH